MTREQAKELLPVITAFSEGKRVQSRRDAGCDWSDCYWPEFVPWQQYRIKPEPHTAWALQHANGAIDYYDTKARAESVLLAWRHLGAPSPRPRLIKLMEVTE